MSDKVDYQSAALAALTSAESGEAAPPAEVPGTTNGAVDSLEGNTAVEETGEEPDGKLEAAAPPKVEPKKIEKTWQQIAADKAKLREEKKAMEANRSNDTRAQAMLQAAQAGDAMGLLAAAGIPWSAAARQVIEGGRTDPNKQQEPKEPDIREEMRALKAELQQAKTEKAKNGILDQIRGKAKADGRFKYTTGLEAEHEAFEFLRQYHAETGELPGENLDESIEIALEAVEQNLAKTGEKWSKVLTKGGSGDTRNNATASPSGTASQQAARTLTNDAGSGPRSASAKPKVLKSTEDYQSEALANLLAASAD